MKHGFLHALGFLTAAMLALGAGPATADAVGPYYASPSWDQQLPASTRFVVLSNWVDANFPSGGAAVLDRETGLVWQRSPSLGNFSTTYTWATASDDCVKATTGNRAGWRLPTINELASVFDPSSTAFPPLPSGHPFTGFRTSDDRFWSATASTNTAHRDVSYTFVLGKFFLVLDGSNPDINALSFWCVRGGLLSGTQ